MLRKQYPFVMHRTMAEVEETESLRRWRDRQGHMLGSRNWWGAARLRALEKQAIEPERVEWIGTPPTHAA